MKVGHFIFTRFTAKEDVQDAYISWQNVFNTSVNSLNPQMCSNPRSLGERRGGERLVCMVKSGFTAVSDGSMKEDDWRRMNVHIDL
jgi:hypothetical protein